MGEVQLGVGRKLRVMSEGILEIAFEKSILSAIFSQITRRHKRSNQRITPPLFQYIETTLVHGVVFFLYKKKRETISPL